MQVDTDRNDDDNTQSFSTPIKHNLITPEITETNTTTTPVQPTVYSRLFQMSYLTSTTSFKLTLSGKYIFVFRVMVNMLVQTSMPNQGHWLKLLI